jgi:AcrR family transcriptional regulator
MTHLAHDEDLRSRKSRRAISKAFVQLLAEKSFESISVIEITTLAEIGQSTFYRHYSDKYDLGRLVINYYLDRLGDLYIQSPDQNGSSRIKLPPATEYCHLLDDVRVLSSINTTELNFEDFAIAHITHRVEHDFLTKQSALQFPEEIAHGLATLAYCFIANMIRRGKSYTLSEVRARVNEFQLALSKMSTVLRD